MAETRFSDGNIRFQVYVKVNKETEEFKAAFEFSGKPEEGILIHSNRRLSEPDKQQLKTIAAEFVARIVFKVQLARPA